MWKSRKNSCLMVLLAFALLESCVGRGNVQTGFTNDNSKSSLMREEETGQKESSIRYFYFEADESDGENKDHTEDEIIELECSEGNSRGLMWVTSDEFVTAREGYLPGFAVLEMKNLILRNDSIFFTIDSYGKKFFDTPIALDVKSEPDAIKKKYREWIQNSDFFWDTITFSGVFRVGTIVLNETKNRLNREFVQKSRDEIEYLRSLSEK